MKRRTRAEKTADNREQVLAAARNVFRSRGFHGASLEAIADEAGFSKGVVYSQFGSKDDLFVALLARRRDQRVTRVLEAVRQAPPEEALAGLLEAGAKVHREDPDWLLLVTEFRIHAARNPELHRRFGELHAQTLAALTEAFESLYDKVALQPRHRPEDLARLLAALDVGAVLEELTDGGGSIADISRDVFQLLLREADNGDDPDL